jgi:hypothetical protein
MTGMKRLFVSGLMLMLVLAGAAFGQKDKDDDEGPTSFLNFLVLKEDNGKPVRNAAVIMHPVNAKGKQGKGGMELKTDIDGKAVYEGIPYGKLRVQVLASGFQTYGDDFDIDKASVEITIKLKRPKSQYSLYDDQPKNSSPPPDQKKPD